MISPLKVAIYARVSTSHHNQNPDVQIFELKKYCESRGWTVTHEIVDHGYSGGTDQRPGFKQLISLARTKTIDAVVVLKLDRLFRSVKHLVTVLEELEQLNVLFVATKDNVDWTTPAGRFFVQVLGSLAELERSILRERTLMGLQHARRKGKRLGRPRLNKEDEIRALRQKGSTHREIQIALSVSKGTVFRALKIPQNPHQTRVKFTNDFKDEK